MSNDYQTQRTIGQLQGAVEGQAQRLERMEEKIDQMAEVIATAKGGWRVLVSVAGVSTTIGAAVAAAIHRLWP